MLALARHHGWPTADYVRADHPVQRRCLAAVAEWTGVDARDLGTGVDGCGVVCYALPLRAMARAYARLGSGKWGVGPDGAGATPEPHGQVPLPTPHSRLVAAMLAHPELIAGEGRPCTELMRALPGRVIAKVGAEGVYSALLVDEGLGVALKVADGFGPAAVLALAGVVAELGLGPIPASLAARPVRNSRGVEVGDVRLKGGLRR
jgi:L-asparaginase II